MKKEDNYSASWSLNEEHIYLTDDVEDYNIIDIKFDKELEFNKAMKIELLEQVIEVLKLQS